MPLYRSPEPGTPPGGSTAQVLAKASGTDFDTEWADPPANDDLVRLSEAILGIPSQGTTDTRFAIPPAVTTQDWFGDDPSRVYFQKHVFLVPWQLKRVDAWFNNIGTAGGARIGLYDSEVGRPVGSPVLEMTKTYTDLGGPVSGGSNNRTWVFNDTVWRAPGIWFLAYTHWGSGMSVLNMKSSVGGPRIRTSISELGPTTDAIGSDWWSCVQDSGNELPDPVNPNALSSSLACAWLSIGFSAP